MAATAALPNASRERLRPTKWGNPLTYVLALAVAAVSIAPVLYVILGGLRTTGQIASKPAGLPNPWVWHTYANVVSQPKFWDELFNSTLIAVFTTLAVAILGVCAAFVLARYQFRGREGVYTYFTIGLLFPAAAGILPLYLLLRDLSLANTYVGVILPQVAFQATAGEQSGGVAISGDEHERAGLAIGGTGCVDEQAHRQGVACAALTVEQGKKRA